MRIFIGVADPVDTTEHVTEIETLYQICVSASRSASPPIKALFTEYDAYVEEQGLDPGHENALFRWICSIGDSTRQQHGLGQSIDLVRGLRSVLAAQGIETILDDEPEDETQSLRVSNTPPRKKDSRPERRVSFGDAHVEETWLSEHTESLRPLPAPVQNGLLSKPPRSGREPNRTQRARSTSSSYIYEARRPSPEHRQPRFEDPKNSTLVFEVSQTQLEQNAEAFYATSEWRTVRRLFHIWHDQALALQSQHMQAWTFAVNHDRRKLLKESFDTLVGLCEERRLERERALQAQRWEDEQQARERDREADLERRLQAYKQQRDEHYVWKAFSNWHESLQYQRRCRDIVKESILKNRYFHRWRKLTIENATKSRSILTQKYLDLWRAQTAQHMLDHKQAEAHYEETLTMRCFQRWFWDFCALRVERWRDQSLQRKAFDTWTVKVESHRTREDQATRFRHQRLLQSALRTMSQRKNELELASQTAESLARRKLTARCFDALEMRAKLTPREKILTLRISLNLKRKAFQVWNLHFTLSRQAVVVDRKRILQSTWTSWNDALRCKALGQRIDERIAVENLYRWALQARLKSFQRAQNEKLMRRTFNGWASRLLEQDAVLLQASIEFETNQRWRLMRFGMTSLNRAMRQREDAERAAVEFANSRALPRALVVWKESSEHARMLAKWASDARFYVLATRTLKLWRERTSEHKHQRRRDAYAQVRSRVKLRIATQCFHRLRDRSVEVQAMRREADQRARARLHRIGIEAFDNMRVKAAQYGELTLQARAIDQQKLLGSALTALVNELIDLATLDQQALLFRQETDLALLAGALKRMQWGTFTAARRVESADALWARNRDQHIKQMLRHWASQASVRKIARLKLQEAGESPSLRPASRAAARSAERPSFPSSPPAAAATPGYMRTPSKTRRPARFKPLPTPAHVTPFAFDQSYLVTTPAPFAAVSPDAGRENTEATDIFEGLTPQITPFARKLRAGGVSATPARVPPSALRTSLFGRSLGPGGTAKSVRFAGSSRFGTGLGRLSSAGESS